jgi:hypothetical protein
MLALDIIAFAHPGRFSTRGQCAQNFPLPADPFGAGQLIPWIV